jgi:hypothetical protein
MGESVVRLGIDFGTANTVAVLALPDRDPRPLIFDGSPLLPSGVCADATGRLLVGQDALHIAMADPASFEPHPKRCIDDGSILLGDRELPVPTLIGAVLDRVAGEASRIAAGPVSETTITCPASWGGRRRETLLAAASALPSTRLLAEPVAAATHFVAVSDRHLPAHGTALVYDFGAGTFDASVVRRSTDGFEVLAAEGLADCGGLDIDAAVVSYLADALRDRDETTWQRLSEPRSASDRRARRQLWDNVRAAKEMLSRTTQTLVHVPLFDVEAPLGREQLEELAAPILDRTATAARAALRTAGLRVQDLDAVFLAGGSSRIPAVQTVLHRSLGIAPTIVEQPELAIAEGSIRAYAGPATVDATAAWPPIPPGAPAAHERPTRRWLPAAVGGTAGRRWPAAILAGTAVAVVIAIVAGLALLLDRPGGNALGGPGGGALGGPGAGGTGSPTPSPTPSPTYPAGIDGCLLGTWRLISGLRQNTIDGNPVAFAGGAGRIVVYRADGTASVDYAKAASYTATVNGTRWEEIIKGTGQFRYHAADGRVTGSRAVAKGTWELRRNGRRNNGGILTLSTEPDQYVCKDNTLLTSTSFASNEFVRVVAASPSAPAPAPPG